MISIHAPREGGDDFDNACNSKPLEFQSTPPARGATLLFLVLCMIPLISIHAPREGGDLVVNTVDGLKGYFNPRPPRGGRRGI